MGGGELITTPYTSHPVEVTSSGCTDGGIPNIVCRAVWGAFNAHRVNANDYFLDRNFGSMSIDWGAIPPIVTVRVHDVHGNVKLMTSRRVDAKLSLEPLELGGPIA